MTPYVKKSILGTASAVAIVLIIDLLEASYHLLAITLIAIILGIAIGVAYDLGAKSEQQPTRKKKYFIFHKRSMLCAPYGVGWSYAEANGGCVLKTEVSWRKINGVCINTPWWACWLLFRRPSW
jgi:hypothetical protein